MCCDLVVVLNSLMFLFEFLSVLLCLCYFPLHNIKFLFQSQLMKAIGYVGPGPVPLSTTLTRHTNIQNDRDIWSTIDRNHSGNMFCHSYG